MPLLDLPEDPAAWTVFQEEDGALLMTHGPARLRARLPTDSAYAQIVLLHGEITFSAEGAFLDEAGVVLFEGRTLPEQAPADLAAAVAWIAARAAGHPARSLHRALHALAQAWAAHAGQEIRLEVDVEGPPTLVVWGRETLRQAPVSAEIVAALRLLVHPPGVEDGLSDWALASLRAAAPATAHARAATRAAAEAALAATGLPWGEDVLP